VQSELDCTLYFILFRWECDLKALFTKRITRENERILLFSASIVFVILMLFLSVYTSPIYPYDFGEDAALFSLLGKGIVNGKIIYRDLFDHKGPILFFIQALGYFLGGHTGIWGLQCCFGIANMLILYALWKLLHTGRHTPTLFECLVVFIAGYTVFFYTFERGNLSEEYSLPFISGCLYLFIRYAADVQNTKEHPYIYSVFYGISLSVLFLMRLNNAVTVCAGILSIFCYLVYHKRFQNLLMNLAFGMVGCMIVFIPVILYFSMHSALSEMMYATFTYNFRYAETIAHNASLGLSAFTLYMPIAISCGMILAHCRRNRHIQFADVLIGLIVLMNLISLLIANRFPHYFTIFIPIYILVLSNYWKPKGQRVLTGLLVICMLFNLFSGGRNFGSSFYRNLITHDPEIQHSIINQDMNRIPDDKRDSVIGYNIPAAYYWNGDIIPCYQYYTHQEWWSQANPDIYTEFLDWLTVSTPSWLLLLPDEDDEGLLKIVDQNYDFQFSDEYLVFYRVKDEHHS